MTRGSEDTTRARWLWIVGVFGIVFGADLVVVAVAGTDIPFHDEWDVNGGWLFPALLSGELRFAELFRFHNEHRIFWTHLQSLGLFRLNGQWDPLAELVLNGAWRGGIAAGLMAWAAAGRSRLASLGIAVALICAFMPINAWHVALWGFESQVLFALALGLGTIALLAPANRTTTQNIVGLACGLAGLLAMAPAALVSVAVLGVVVVRMLERRSFPLRDSWPEMILLVLAIALRAGGAEADALHPGSVLQGLTALGRALAWPHTGQPWAAVILNLPLVVVVTRRIFTRTSAAAGEDVVLATAFWAVAIAFAIAWARGGGDELSFGVPSRYADFLVLLPLANAWCAMTLVRSCEAKGFRRAAAGATLWGAFVLVGWLGLSAENVRRVIVPRTRDTLAPVRLTHAFQQTGDPAVFAGQPRLLVPHPNADSVAAVLRDPRLQGKLPPSLQPERPLGPLSRGARWLLQRDQ